MNTHEWDKLVLWLVWFWCLEALLYTDCPEGGSVAPASSSRFSPKSFSLFFPFWGCIPSPSGDGHRGAVMYPTEEETPLPGSLTSEIL